MKRLNFRMLIEYRFMNLFRFSIWMIWITACGKTSHHLFVKTSQKMTIEIRKIVSIMKPHLNHLSNGGLINVMTIDIKMKHIITKSVSKSRQLKKRYQMKLILMNIVKHSNHKWSNWRIKWEISPNVFVLMISIRSWSDMRMKVIVISVVNISLMTSDQHWIESIIISVMSSQTVNSLAKPVICWEIGKTLK